MVTPRRQRAASARRGRTGDPPVRTVFSLGEEETFELGRTLARTLKPGDLVLLVGELGLGKTVFARGVAAGLGVAPEEVSSPSFTLVQEYTGGKFPIFHLDLYRIEDPEETADLGIEEILAGGGVVMVEWGERLPAYLRRGAIEVRFHDLGEDSRRIEIRSLFRALERRSSDA